MQNNNIGNDKKNTNRHNRDSLVLDGSNISVIFK